MHILLRVFFIFAFFALNVPSHAESACGSDTSSDPDIAKGKDVWLNGYCQSFLPCRLVLAKFHACQEVENFLTNLNANKSAPLTEDQVEAALVKTNQSTVSASTERKTMSKDIALIERNRVSEMDAKAEDIVKSSCGSWGCDRLLETTVDPVIRAVEALNSNSEYLDQLPKYSPIAAVETAARFGWNKDGAVWVFSGEKSSANFTANTGTLKDYLLSVPECQKLHDKLAQEIKAEPTKEPINLSFFEGECVAQVADYKAEVSMWRQNFKDASSQLTTTTQPASTSGTVEVTQEQQATVSQSVFPIGEIEVAREQQTAIVALGDWNDDVVAESSGQPRRIARRFDLPGGCYLYFYAYEDSDSNKHKVTWDGPCISGQTVNGTGHFMMDSDYTPVDYSAAQIVNGRLEGGPYLDTTSGGESTWYELHRFTGGCDKAEFLGYDRETLIYYAEREESNRGASKQTEEAYWRHAQKTHVLNKTYKGVKYYTYKDDPSEDSIDSDKYVIDEYKHCIAAFAKLR